MQRKSYGEELLDWGNSGSLYPNLVPDQESLTDIWSVQQELLLAFPDANPVEKPHMTLFFLSPRRLFEYMVANINPEVDQKGLYLDLSGVISTMLLVKTDLIGMHEVTGIDNFGDDYSILALKVNLSDPAKESLAITKSMVVHALRRHGATAEDLAIMAENDRFRWLLGESETHVSLATNVIEHRNINPNPAGRLAVGGSVEIPEAICFDEFSTGSVKVPGKNPAAWYLGLDFSLDADDEPIEPEQPSPEMPTKNIQLSLSLPGNDLTTKPEGSHDSSA